MILPFSTQLNGKPTYFVEKIHKCFGLKEINMIAGLDPSLHYPKDYNFVAKDKLPAKLHTIREDAKERWKPGTMIDFFINCRQKSMFRFAPRIPVVTVQKINIVWYNKKLINNEVEIYIDGSFYAIVYFKNKVINYVDNCVFSDEKKLKALALNDGFDTVEEFLDYFNDNFKGKLIHWTNLKY